MNKAIAVLFFVLIFLILYTMGAPAQINHMLHHADYKSWFSRSGISCCNNQDCGELAEEDERVDGGVLAVRVEGTWCPVQPKHYLQSGNVPDATTSHVCVQKRFGNAPGSPCDRLLCYQPKPLT